MHFTTVNVPSDRGTSVSENTARSNGCGKPGELALSLITKCCTYGISLKHLPSELSELK